MPWSIPPSVDSRSVARCLEAVPSLADRQAALQRPELNRAAVLRLEVNPVAILRLEVNQVAVLRLVGNLWVVPWSTPWAER